MNVLKLLCVRLVTETVCEADLGCALYHFTWCEFHLIPVIRLILKYCAGA